MSSSTGHADRRRLRARDKAAKARRQKYGPWPERQKMRTPCTRDAFQRAVERMTNYQRSFWARAGYPGLQQHDISKLPTIEKLGFVGQSF